MRVNIVHVLGSWEVVWGQFDLCQMDLPRVSEKLKNRLTIRHSKLIDFAIKLLSNYCILLSDHYRGVEVKDVRRVHAHEWASAAYWAPLRG